MNDATQNITRTCANCACHILQSNPMIPGSPPTSACMLNMPMLLQGEGQQPMLDKNQKPVMMKDKNTGLDVVRMEKIVKQFFIYPPTQPELVCFDGWRPIGTLPGDKFSQAKVDAMMDSLYVALQPVLESMGVRLVKPPLDG